MTEVSRTPSAITVDDRATYEWGARKRPYVHPLRTPAGHTLTRNAPDDHPWHHGLWFTIKFVNEENFWEEYDAYGVLRHDAEPEVSHRTDGVTLTGTLTWTRPDRETVALREERRWTYRPLDADAYALDFETTLVAPTDVVYDRTPFTTWGGYGGLAFRGAGEWHDTRLLLDDGVERERTLGERSAWCALDGLAGDGDAPVGIAVLAAPDGPRHPVPWYASTRAATYGDEGWSNFLNAAFLWDEPLPVAAGEPLSFAYRVVVHDGAWDQDRISASHDDYVSGRG
ncbi:MAG TPA: hypothetical protein DCS55_19145 [Acidimicrobiaceae bacterium]|nr:hypothetical protein [Acidimicrobiaceae bacterium]